MKKRFWVLCSAMTAVFVGAAGLAALPAKAEETASGVTVAEYVFADGTDLGKDSSGNGNHLVGVGSPVQWTGGEETGVTFDGASALVAAGDSSGYDFADYLADEDFTMTVGFYLPKDLGGKALQSRNCVFSVWGFMYNDSNDQNIGSAANYRASALMYDSYSSGAATVNIRFGIATATRSDGTDYNPYWEENELSVSTDAWHTASFRYEGATRRTVLSVDGEEKWTKTAREDNTFKSRAARFTLGGYYTDPQQEGKGLYNGSMVGSLKDVKIVRQVTEGNKYNKLVSYDFKDSGNFGKANETMFDMEKKGEGTMRYDAEKGALYTDVKTALVAPKDGDGYDFMDYMAGSSFTVSTSFLLPKNFEEGQKADGRGTLFSLWGLWNGNAYGAGSDNRTMSSLVYDAYDSGAEKAWLKLAFAYDNDDGSICDGWHSKYYKEITTDEFHTATLSITGRNVTVYVDGEKFWTVECSENNNWKNQHMSFCIGGAYGDGGLASGSGNAYFKYFDIYDFAMTDAEMGKLYSGSLDGVTAKTISAAEEAPSSVTVPYTATDDQILAKAPLGSRVTVSTADGDEAAANVKWTGVEKKGATIYLVGNLYGAGLSNINGVKAYMPVEVERIETKNAFVEYTFDDAQNIGKSTKGGMFDLETFGAATIENGVIMTNKAVLASKKDALGYDFMDYMNDFTVETTFLSPKGVATGHSFLLAFYGMWSWGGISNADAACIMLNDHGETANKVGLRVGFAYSDSSQENGVAKPEWSQYTKEIELGVWHNLAVSYRAEDRTVTVFIDGDSICSYQVYDEARFKNDRVGFSVGGVRFKDDEGNEVNNWAENVGIRSLRIYDYAVSAADLQQLSVYGEMPATAAAPADEKIVEITSAVPSIGVETASLTAETALEAIQKADRSVRVTLANEEVNVKLGVLWQTASANGDGSFTVTGTVLGAYNPDGIAATATVKIAAYEVGFTGNNASAKIDGSVAEKTEVSYGGSVSFTAEAAEGYEIKSVKAGDVELTAENGVYTLGNITADVTVEIIAEKSGSGGESSSSVADSSTSESDSSGKEESSSADSGSESSSGSVAAGCGSALGCVLLLPMVVAGAWILRKKKS